MMDSSPIAIFSTITRTSETTAANYLSDNNWDIKHAVDAWIENEMVTANVDKRKEVRGIEMARGNELLVRQARAAIMKDLCVNAFYEMNNYLMPPPETTFVIPNVYQLSTEFREFIETDLLAKLIMKSLEKCCRLNWWHLELGLYNRLWPVYTVGDGNCLLHAASLSMWGFIDRFLTLRVALYQFFLYSPIIPRLKRRWMWRHMFLHREFGVRYSESEWENEWSTVLELLSPKCRNSNKLSLYGSLEEIHIFVLAHLIQRPIIVICDSILNDSLNQPFSPVMFGGIYVPFEADSKYVNKVPLLLGFENGHFSSLCYMTTDNSNQSYLLPLEELNGTPFPIQFSFDPGENCDWSTCVPRTPQLSARDRINMLRPYLELVDAYGDASSPDNDSEEDIAHHFMEATTPDDESGPSQLSPTKSKAAKQLQTLGSRFGSIGRNMGRKLRKNFGSLPILSKGKKEQRKKLFCAEIAVKVHPYQKELLTNYLTFAYERFLFKELNLSEGDELGPLIKQALAEGPLHCFNTNCKSHASVLTSYMCKNCYEDQKRKETARAAESACFGVGNSRFFCEPDSTNYENVRRLPVFAGKTINKTLYLSNSTFYNDTDTPFNSNAEKTDGDAARLASIISTFDFSNIKVPGVGGVVKPANNIWDEKLNFNNNNENVVDTNLLNDTDTPAKKDDMNNTTLEKEHID